MSDDDLDQMFAAARANPPPAPAALQARVLADAASLRHAAPLVTAPSPAPVSRGGVWAGLAALFGGSGVLAGMATATVAGFWIGFSQPSELGAMGAALTGASAEIDMMPGIDALLDEAP